MPASSGGLLRLDALDVIVVTRLEDLTPWVNVAKLKNDRGRSGAIKRRGASETDLEAE